jgi:hypothetical protein
VLLHDAQAALHPSGQQHGVQQGQRGVRVEAGVGQLLLGQGPQLPVGHLLSLVQGPSEEHLTGPREGLQRFYCFGRKQNNCHPKDVCGTKQMIGC